MNRVNVAKLKSQLSSYLRRTRRGERFVVMDRNEAVAELSPAPEAGAGWLADRAAEGRVRLPTRALGDIVLTPLGRPVRIQDILDADRGDR